MMPLVHVFTLLAMSSLNCFLFFVFFCCCYSGTGGIEYECLDLLKPSLACIKASRVDCTPFFQPFVDCALGIDDDEE
jgi:hypothetical protein